MSKLGVRPVLGARGRDRPGGRSRAVRPPRDSCSVAALGRGRPAPDLLVEAGARGGGLVDPTPAPASDDNPELWRPLCASTAAPPLTDERLGIGWVRVIGLTPADHRVPTALNPLHRRRGITVARLYARFESVE